jgi:fermentation-respiration switch protein FrsA (DUF1100 family)
MTTLKLLLGVLVAFGGFVALMYVAQRSLMYFPDRHRTPPAAAGLPSAEEAVLDSEGGERVIVWHVPPRGAKPVVIYFHGNGGALHHRADRFRALTADGSPSESGFVADGEAAYRFAVARYPAERVVLFGESLGTGVAVAIAAEHKIGGLILQAPFTSAVDVAALVYWFLPVRFLMKDPFYSDRRIAKVTAPVLILHGARDSIVPIGLGERLYALAGEPKRFVRLREGSHNDLDGHGALTEVLAFLGEMAR